ncbi:BnaCnng18960D [Brassica napus]|uniref:BnaCnng18960D protein n=1 Tax=Brassica napus TaxID=3708 RepID=A0A078ILJ9_BRANA|nr:BnaCnng18960D [Brassica napus]
MNGLAALLNMQVHYISFSAHADYAQMSTFLKELMPLDIVLVHGEANELMRLTQKLFTEFPDGNTRIMNPKNCESVEKYFTLEKMEKTIGRLAEKTLDVGDSVSGILVKKGFTYQIMAPDDLHVFSQLSTGTVTQRITIPLSGAFGKHISLQWSSDPISDMVSDPIVALVLNISREVPKIVVEEEVDNGKLVISVDDNVAHLDKESGDVESEHDGLNERVRVAFHRIQSAVKPIPLSAD